jgi:aminoglycoside phosphotransferase (APT) family kinase protein
MLDDPGIHPHWLADGWRIVQTIELGTTARVWIVEKNGQRRALKTRHDEIAKPSLKREYDLLNYLSTTEMAQYVPAVGDWLKKAAGFWMEYLRYPTQEELIKFDLPSALGTALRTLHALPLPTIPGLADDRPSAAAAICDRLRSSFESLLSDDRHWLSLSIQDRANLQRVRARYADYAALLTVLETALSGAKCALIHGDLSADNLMVRQDGSLVIADWGEARITSPFVDVAYLIVHSEWSDVESELFLNAYFGMQSADREAACPVIELLVRLHRYHACVRSLHWLNEAGEGLDALGYAFFERQLRQI